MGSGINVVAEPPNQDLTDCTPHSHGTHVSGIIGGTRYGVAKAVTLHPVKILDYCPVEPQGSWLDICEAIDWIVQNHGTEDRIGPAVVNLSYNRHVNSLPKGINLIVRELLDAGIPFVQSAGNIGLNGLQACDWSLGNDPLLPEVIVVGGVDISEFNGQEVTGRWLREPPSSPGGPDPSYPVCSPGSPGFPPDCASNTGQCLDLWAPAGHIVSAGTDGGACRLSGTSMAAPHVSGAVALYLERRRCASPQEVQDAVVAAAAPGVLDTNQNSPYRIRFGSPNLLLRTPIPVLEGCPLFDDDFETGDISAWDGSYTRTVPRPTVALWRSPRRPPSGEATAWRSRRPRPRREPLPGRDRRHPGRRERVRRLLPLQTEHLAR